MVLNRTAKGRGYSVENYVFRFYRDALIALLLLQTFIPALLLFLSGRLNDSDALIDSAANPVWQAIVVFVFLNSLILTIMFRVPLRWIVWILLPMIPMIIWIVLSYAWSAYPDLTLRRSIRFVIELLSIVLLGLTFRNRKEMLRMLYWTFFLINILDICSLAVPSLSFVVNGFAGVHLNKNLAGLFFFLALPVFALAALDRSISYSRLLAVFACVTALSMLGITLSKSAIGVGFLALTLVLVTKFAASRDLRLRMVVPIFGLLVAAVAVLVVLDLGITRIFDLLFGDSTLTGRDQIWRYALYKFDQNEWLGTGYGALWQVGADVGNSLRESGARWVANQAHDGYIDVLAQLGYPGFIYLFVFIVIMFMRLFNASNALEAVTLFGLNDYALYLLWGAVIYNVTETSFFRVGHSMWTMLVLVSTSALGSNLPRTVNLGLGRRHFLRVR